MKPTCLAVTNALSESVTVEGGWKVGRGKTEENGVIGGKMGVIVFSILWKCAFCKPKNSNPLINVDLGNHYNFLTLYVS